MVKEFLKTHQPLGMPKELLEVLVRPSIRVSSRSFRNLSKHGGNLRKTEPRGLPRVFRNTDVNRPRFLGVQKGPNLVEDILGDRSDSTRVDHRDGFAEVSSLNGFDHKVGLGRLIGLRGTASREFSLGDGLAVWQLSGIQSLEISEVELMVPSMKVFGKTGFGGGWGSRRVCRCGQVVSGEVSEAESKVSQDASGSRDRRA